MRFPHVLLGLVCTLPAGCSSAGTSADGHTATSATARDGSIPSTVIQARHGGAVPAGACVIVRPPARWILRVPDVDPSPEKPGYLTFDHPEQFASDPACESSTAVRVAPDIRPGRYTIAVVQDDRRLRVPVTVTAQEPRRPFVALLALGRARLAWWPIWWRGSSPRR